LTLRYFTVSKVLYAFLISYACIPSILTVLYKLQIMNLQFVIFSIFLVLPPMSKYFPQTPLICNLP
jgi:hypothetical protein